MGTWKSIDNPPKKDGIYMVKFKFSHQYNIHDNTASVYREFINGNCTLPYYLRPWDGSYIVAWLDKEE